MSSNLDLRISKYLIRKLNGYVHLRMNNKHGKKHANLLAKFQDSDFITHFLTKGLKIRLYRDSVLTSFIFDGFETDEIDFLNSLLRKGDTFIDIGANVGLFSLYASEIVGSSGSVLAFEPSGSTYSRLLENIELNKITNIKTFNIGLADQDSVLELNISKNGYEAWNTFVQSDDQKFSEKEKVSVKSFDHFIEENFIDSDRITLIKLDVEGFELKVLKGATQLLSKENAPVLIVEYSDALSVAAGHCCHEIYKYLEGFGYTWYSYISIEKKLVYDPMRINYPYVNLIAIKNPDKIEGLKKFTIQMKPRKI